MSCLLRIADGAWIEEFFADHIITSSIRTRRSMFSRSFLLAVCVFCIVASVCTAFTFTPKAVGAFIAAAGFAANPMQISENLDNAVQHPDPAQMVAFEKLGGIGGKRGNHEMNQPSTVPIDTDPSTVELVAFEKLGGKFMFRCLDVWMFGGLLLYTVDVIFHI